MSYVHESIRALGALLGGCVGMWMGAMLALIIRLVRGAFWITIVGHADWPSWAETYQDAMFFLAAIVGAGAGARFARGCLRKDEENSTGLET